MMLNSLRCLLRLRQDGRRLRKLDELDHQSAWPHRLGVCQIGTHESDTSQLSPRFVTLTKSGESRVVTVLQVGVSSWVTPCASTIEFLKTTPFWVASFTPEKSRSYLFNSAAVATNHPFPSTSG